MIRKDQAHRILEDIQRLALSCRLNQKLAKSETQRLAAQLTIDEADAIGRDLVGMLNGNSKKEVTQ